MAQRECEVFAYFGVGIKCKGVLKVVNCNCIDMYCWSSFILSVASGRGMLKKMFVTVPFLKIERKKEIKKERKRKQARK